MTALAIIGMGFGSFMLGFVIGFVIGFVLVCAAYASDTTSWG